MASGKGFPGDHANMQRFSSVAKPAFRSILAGVRWITVAVTLSCFAAARQRRNRFFVSRDFTDEQLARRRRALRRTLARPPSSSD